MNKIFFIVITILFLGQNCLPNPWTDDDYCYARFDGKEISFSHALIRKQPVLMETESTLRENHLKSFMEPSKALIFFTGIAGIALAGRHIRKK